MAKRSGRAKVGNPADNQSIDVGSLPDALRVFGLNGGRAPSSYQQDGWYSCFEVQTLLNISDDQASDMCRRAYEAGAAERVKKLRQCGTRIMLISVYRFDAEKIAKLKKEMGL